MTLEALKNADKVIGIKQVTKAVNKGLATCVFLAGDADARVIEPLRTLCAEKGLRRCLQQTCRHWARLVPLKLARQPQQYSDNLVVKNFVEPSGSAGLLINNKFSI